MPSLDTKKLIAIPKSWLTIDGKDTVAGTGYTRWRYWDNETSVSTAISYNSHTAGLTSLRAKVVGLYLEANEDNVLGILVSKRIKGQWTEKQLILLDRIHHWANLDSNQMLHGQALALTQNLLKNLYRQISKSNIRSEAARKSEKKYLLGECCAIHLGLFPLLEKSLSDVFSSLDCPDHEANEKILLALQETNNQLL